MPVGDDLDGPLCGPFKPIDHGNDIYSPVHEGPEYMGPSQGFIICKENYRGVNFCKDIAEIKNRLGKIEKLLKERKGGKVNDNKKAREENEIRAAEKAHNFN